jgi:hypothetical protein
VDQFAAEDLLRAAERADRDEYDRFQLHSDRLDD